MIKIVSNFGIVATDDPDYSFYGSAFYCVKQRFRSAAQGIQNCFNRETNHGRIRNLRDINPFMIAVVVVFNRHGHNLFRALIGFGLFKLDVSRAGKASLIAGRDKMGMITFAEFGQGRKDALDIDTHQLDRPGNNGQLLLQLIAGNRNPVPHQNFIAGTAHANHINPLGSMFPGQFFHRF